MSEPRLLLFKAHISAYTRKDGTFVAAHEDRRTRKAHVHGDKYPKVTSYKSVRNAVASLAKTLGYEVILKDSSSVSKSEYLYLKDANGKVIKLRFSDHADVSMSAGGASQLIKDDDSENFVGSDYSVLLDDAIETLAKRSGAEIPASIANSISERKRLHSENVEKLNAQMQDAERAYYLSKKPEEMIASIRSDKKKYEELIASLPDNAKRRNAIYKLNELDAENRIKKIEEKMAFYRGSVLKKSLMVLPRWIAV